MSIRFAIPRISVPMNMIYRLPICTAMAVLLSASCSDIVYSQSLKASLKDNKEHVALSSDNLPHDMKWEPRWRDKGDCGPLSVYILMKLLGHEVSVQSVKEVIPFTSEQGCSLEVLSKGCQQLDFPARIKFVAPGDLANVPFPYILHRHISSEKKTGHFLVVTSYSSSKRQFSAINTNTERSEWYPKDRIFKKYSGYLLVPNRGFEAWRIVLWIEIVCFGFVILVFIRQFKALAT